MFALVLIAMFLIAIAVARLVPVVRSDRPLTSARSHDGGDPRSARLFRPLT